MVSFGRAVHRGAMNVERDRTAQPKQANETTPTPKLPQSITNGLECSHLSDYSRMWAVGMLSVAVSQRGPNRAS
jgi:hypothetical protein